MKLILVLLLVAISSAAIADTYVHGYTKNNGTYVEPYYRTDPNSTKFDNYSTKGNVNPYNGNEGRVDPYYTPPPSYQYTPPPSYQYNDPYNNK